MRVGPSPPLVLAYHGVAVVPFDHDPHRLFVSPRRVRRDVEQLRRWGYQLVTFSTFAERAGEGRAGGLAALTFDDGFADNLTTLVPLLAAAGVPATVFAVSGWLGGSHPDAPWAPVLGADDLRRLAAAGVEVGCHTRTHPDLTTVDDAALGDELVGGRDDLEDLLQAPVRTLAYPYGAADGRVRRAAAAAGFVAACRIEANGSLSDPLDLPRQSMGHGSSSLGLRLKRVDRYEPLLRAPGARRIRRWSRRTHSAVERRRAAALPTAGR